MGDATTLDAVTFEGITTVSTSILIFNEYVTCTVAACLRTLSATRLTTAKTAVTKKSSSGVSAGTVPESMLLAVSRTSQSATGTSVTETITSVGFCRNVAKSIQTYPNAWVVIVNTTSKDSRIMTRGYVDPSAADVTLKVFVTLPV